MIQQPVFLLVIFHHLKLAKDHSTAIMRTVVKRTVVKRTSSQYPTIKQSKG
ncbi:hypothetical protein JCM18904_5147 [Vibrio sp. JCM 18904]|nr:hypothetical protein JCM18904_5147 [Vibrio sp. JCM 18904]